MMKVMRNVTVLHVSSFALLSLGLCAGASAINLLQNPGFEAGNLSSWTLNSNSSGTNWQIATDQVHSGGFSAKVVGDALIEQTFVPTLADSISEVSLWVKQDPGALFEVDLLYTDGTDDFFVETPARTGFFKYDYTNMLEPGKLLTTLQVYGYDGGSNGPTWLDDATVSVAPVPEPATLAALGLGAVGLLRRRKRA